jgi:hypothetical protein
MDTIENRLRSTVFSDSKARSMTETVERSRRLIIAYAIMLDAFAPGLSEPGMENSYAPEWRCWLVAPVIVGLMIAGYSFCQLIA